MFSGHGYSTYVAHNLGQSLPLPMPSRSFPPLIPLLSGTLDHFFHTGLYSLCYVNILVFLLLFGVALALAKELSKGSALWLVFPLFMFWNRPFGSELVAGCTIPVTLLTILMSALAMLRSSKTGKITPWDACFGAMLAAGTLARFDMLPFALIALSFYGAVLATSKITIREIAVKSAVSCAAFALVSLPWWLRNMAAFGSFFTSDHNITVLSTYPDNVYQTFWAAGHPELVYANPGLWLSQRLNYFLQNIVILTHISAGMAVTAPLFAALCWKQLKREQRILLLFIMIFCVAIMASISLLRYHDARYFSIAHFLLFFALVLMAEQTLNTPNQRRLLLGVLWSCALLAGATSLRLYPLTHFKLLPQNLASQQKQFDNLAKNLHLASDKHMPFVATDNPETLYFFTGWPTLYLPRNVEKCDRNFTAWLEHWQPTHIIAPEARLRAFGMGRYISLTHVDRELALPNDPVFNSKGNILTGPDADLALASGYPVKNFHCPDPAQ